MASLLENTTLLSLLLLTGLPFVLLATTSFVKIAVVLSVLRNALGAGQVPSAMVVTLLAGLLSAYVMSPVADRVMATVTEASAAPDEGVPLTLARLAEVGELWTAASAPVRLFLAKHAGERELGLFRRLASKARAGRPDAGVADDDLTVLMPAFLISELKEGLQMGFLVLLPFLVIDLVVATVLATVGLHSVSAATVALPLKLLLFVLVDGFYVLSEALVSGYL